MSKLFEAVRAGALQLPNRFVMAPLTRCRADANHVPTDLMVHYYKQRASAGLIVAEATMVSEGHSAFNAREPGCYNDAQQAGWKRVTDAVHESGGRIVLQIWHGGRSCHSELGGKTPVAPSAVAIDGEIHVPGKGKLPYEVPRELRDDELPAIIADFAAAAKRAIAAGFDGVEIHGANGYLLDQFLRTSANQRKEGRYAGPLENRARLLLEVVDAVTAAVGADRVGVRISPLNSYTSMKDEDPIALTSYVASQLDARKIAYLHLMRADLLGIQTGDVISVARANFHGTLIVNVGYTPAEAQQAIEAGAFDAVALGRPFISNPSLVDKVKSGLPLADPDPSKFYTHDAEGYTDYA